jgi:hypothetical protein
VPKPDRLGRLGQLETFTLILQMDQTFLFKRLLSPWQQQHAWNQPVEPISTELSESWRSDCNTTRSHTAHAPPLKAAIGGPAV